MPPARTRAGPASMPAMSEEEQIGVRCGGRFSTYPELFGRALRATGGLRALGVEEEDRVALLLHNSIEFLEASIATVPLGASAVPINWHWRGEEIEHVLLDSGAKVLIVHEDLWPGIAERVPSDVTVVIVPADAEADANGRGGAGASIPEGALSWPEWLAASEPWAQPPEGAPVSIIYTSGTTGRPKGVVRDAATDEQREGTQALLGDMFRLREGERTVIPAPMYHTAPNVYALSAAVRGMDMTIMTRFDPEELPAHRRAPPGQRRADGPDDVRAPARAARGGARAATTSPRCDWIVHAAAPCPPEVKRATIEWLGPIVAEYYGSTETGPVVVLRQRGVARASRHGRAGRSATRS